MRCLVARIVLSVGCVCLGAAAPEAFAATFRFDLTDVIGADATTGLEEIVDLGVEFAQVDSAWIEFSGRFTPGLVTLATLPPNSGPILESDTVNYIVRLGEPGTAWIDKDLYAIQSFEGFSGDVSFDLPLFARTPSPPNALPVLLPSGKLAPAYSFLLDGRFGLSAGSTHLLAALYLTVEPPRFELSEFALTIEGTAVPEPTAAAAASLGLLGLVARRVRRGNRCADHAARG